MKKNLKDLLNASETFELKEVDFSDKKYDKVFKKLKKRIESMEKEYEVDFEDLKNLVFKPLIK